MRSLEDNTTRVLLACARARLDEQRAGVVRSLLAEPVDWEHFARAASRHGVLPLVCRSLKQAAWDLIPARAQRRLRSRVRRAAAHGFALACELPPILDLLGAHGIRALPFKGPALSSLLYGAPYLREFIDLDVLVAPQDARGAIGLLLSQGYAGVHGAAPANSHLSLIYGTGGVSLEIQWDLPNRWALKQPAGCAPLDFEELWRRRETVLVCGRAVPTLSAEDTALALCVHGARHDWRRLVWLCDFARLAESRRDIDWRRVLEMSVAYHCRRRLALAFSLAAGMLGAELPPGIAAWIDKDRGLRGTAVRTERALLAEPEADAARGCASDLAALAFSVAVLDTRRERLRVWLEFLREHMKPNDHDHHALTLPRQLALAYYLARPARLLWTYGPHSALQFIAAGAGRFVQYANH